MAYIIAAALVAIALAAWWLLSRPMSPERFMQAVREKMKRDHPEIEVTAPLDFGWELSIGDGKVPFFLNNTYAVYRANRRNFDAVVENALAGIADIPDMGALTWEDAKSRVLPMVKPREWLDGARELPNGASLVDNLVPYDFRPGLNALVVLDSERTMAFVIKDKRTAARPGSPLPPTAAS